MTGRPISGNKKWSLSVGLAAMMALSAAACGGDGGTTTTAPAPTTTRAPDTTQAPTTAPAAMAAGLADVCPDPLVIQLDWEPESEHGGIYQLVGDGYSIDADAKRVTGPLTAGGEDTGIDIEVRIGGAAVGYQPVHALMYQDQDIFMGFVRLSEVMASSADLPIMAVMATFDKSAYSVYWDPETYPNVEEIADLKDEGVTIMLGRPDVFQDYWLDEGIIEESQMDLTDPPKPATFIAAGGRIAEAGFASAEPYLYQFEVADDWGKPVKVQLIHDTGFRDYFQAVGLRTADIAEYSDCLGRLVPMLQQAHVDFLNDPDRTNRLILDLVDTYNTGWPYSQGAADFAVKTMLELGIMGNGPDDTLGNFEMARVSELIEIIDRVTDADVSGLSPDDVASNEFIDESIGL